MHKKWFTQTKLNQICFQSHLVRVLVQTVRFQAVLELLERLEHFELLEHCCNVSLRDCL